jgi:hypothetical protein
LSASFQSLEIFSYALQSLLDEFAMAIENDGPQVEAVAILFLVLSWIAVGLRCYVKLFMKKVFNIDDWLAVASLV